MLSFVHTIFFLFFILLFVVGPIKNILLFIIDPQKQNWMRKRVFCRPFVRFRSFIVYFHFTGINMRKTCYMHFAQFSHFALELKILFLSVREKKKKKCQAFVAKV